MRIQFPKEHRPGAAFVGCDGRLYVTDQRRIINAPDDVALDFMAARGAGVPDEREDPAPADRPLNEYEAEAKRLETIAANRTAADDHNALVNAAPSKETVAAESGIPMDKKKR